MKKESRGPLIVAIALLVLPLLYVGSYSALVDPHCRKVAHGRYMIVNQPEHYRVSGGLPATVFWPLEQIDRKLRRDFWVDPEFPIE